MNDNDELQLRDAVHIYLRKNNITQLKNTVDKLVEQFPHNGCTDPNPDIRKNGGREIFLRLPDVIKQVGIKRATIYKKIRRKEFPAPIKIGERTSVWPESRIIAWIAAHKAMN